MSGALEVACRLALDTFKVSVNDKSRLLQRVLKLRESVAALKIEDVGIKDFQIQALHRGSKGEIDAPVGYVEIFEDDTLTVGAFLLKERSALPLHNHPSMYGLLKVLHGQIKVRSFDILEKSAEDDIPKFNALVQPRLEEVWKLRPHPETKFSASSGAILTTPTEGNLHQIEAVGGPAVFVDFISPPYSEALGRDCYYFRELGLSEEQSNPIDRGIVWACRTMCPRSYYCDQLEYLGPFMNFAD